MQGPGARPDARWLALIDLFAVVATAFGVATSLGLGALQINSGLNAVFGLPIGAASQVGIIAATVLVLGPTRAILDTLTNTLGAYLSEFVRMSLRLSPLRESNWVADWTILHWAWWLSWSPFVGLFIARVSRGRTIREFVAGTLLVSLVAVSLLVAGGLEGIQTAAIVAALPFAVVIVLLCVSLHRALAREWRARDRAERAMRRRARDATSRSDGGDAA